MRKLDLCGVWKLKVLGENVYGIPQEAFDAQVPGSVYGTLLADGKMPDPYYRDNELTATRLMENDFVYERTFALTEEDLAADGVMLTFEGIDTLAEVYVNGVLAGRPDNMHREWEFDLKALAHPGENTLRVELHSPIRYIKEENEKVYTGGVSEAMSGYPHLRKAHCMFGWDWGPRLPDAGIWRPVFVRIIDSARIDSVYVIQHHEKMSAPEYVEGPDGKRRLQVSESAVRLELQLDIEVFREEEELHAVVSVTGPDGHTYFQDADGQITIPDPKLWWPRGYGSQPLYTVTAKLYGADGRQLDIWQRRIGLRTLTVDTAEDERGSQFAHQVNGVDIFAMGADYIPEDNILSRVTRERTGKLLQQAVEAHYNCIRVWGGGYYPDDYFYDLCDELGLLVWQDMMFACASYELSEAFEENVKAEIAQNVRRLRHHASLALWCGNNEMESQMLDHAWKPSQKQFYDYIKLYEYIIPGILKREDPNTFYWPSSPSSGGNYDDPWNENRGDMHYWGVWHGNKPFTSFREYRFRYLSEFGFQSFPCLKTVKTFTEQEDRNIFSRVMEMHQRSGGGNGKMLNYLSATYQYPKDFDSLLFATQLLQAEGIRYGVEHFRRHRGDCMGTIVWQLNDIWPVASWSSIDYFGRWKALHYAEKRMFAPVLLSCNEVGEVSERPYCSAEPGPIEKSAQLCVTNDTLETVCGLVEWELRDSRGSILLSGRESVEAEPLSSLWLGKQDFSDRDELGVYFCYRLLSEGKEISGGTSLFTAPKHFRFCDPGLKLTREGKELTVSAQAYAMFVEIEGVDGDVKLSDNYFDMNPGQRTVTIVEGDASAFRVRSVWNLTN